jgi:uncharacterized delta-60 repeat protein
MNCLWDLKRRNLLGRETARAFSSSKPSWVVLAFGWCAFVLSAQADLPLPTRPATCGTVVTWGDDSRGQTTIPAGLTGVVALAGGEYHTLALKSDGTVVAWGDNRYAQSTVPVGLAGVVALAAGYGHSLALKSDGIVVAWGGNYDGQSTVPAGLDSVVAVAAGRNHSLALKSDGTVVAWGWNNQGQSTVPAGLGGVVAVGAGDSHSLALKNDGTVVAWGYGAYGQCSVPTGLSGVVALGGAFFHSLALTSDGTMMAWGNDFYGQTSVPTGLNGAVAVAVGGCHNLALKSDRTVVAWGAGSPGSLGGENYGQSTVPADLTNVVAVAVGSYHSLALQVVLPTISVHPTNQVVCAGTSVTLSVAATGTMPLSYQWRKGSADLTEGGNISGATTATLTLTNVQLGDAGSYTVVVGNSAGTSTSSAAILTVRLPVPMRPTGFPLSAPTLPGSVVAWGRNDYGQTNVPEDLTNAVALTAGVYHSLALKNDGTVVAWGYNNYGQSTVPSDLTGVVALAAGSGHSLALKSDGTVTAWGSDWSGESTAPAGLCGAVAIAAGAIHSLALKSDGTVAAWGDNSGGQSAVPVGLTDVVALAAGGWHSLALKSDGTVAAWGDNGNGQSTVPVGLTSVVALAAGGAHSLALKSDGTVVAWGNNGQGRSTVPAGLTNVVAIAAGYGHSLALQNDGTVVAWGSDNYGQCAVPSTLSSVVTAVAAGGYQSLALGPVLPPKIATQPKSQTVGVGAGATFTVVAGSMAPLSYQWRKDGVNLVDGVNISGANTATLTLTNLQLGDSGSYVAVVSNSAGATNSAAAALSVRTVFPLTIPSRPASFPLSSPARPLLQGTLITWGGSNYFQSIVPSNLTDVVSVSAGDKHNLVLRKDGTVAAWTTSVPAGLSNVVAIAAGYSHDLALKSDGTVAAWGNNSQGESTVPAGLSNVVALAAGWGRSLALKSDGTMASWGSRPYGESEALAGLSNVVALSAGEYHGLALQNDGTVVAWGNTSSYGQANVPAGLSGVVAIAAGCYHSLALKSDGTVVAWGAGSPGTTGEPHRGQATVPTGLTNVVAIAAGYAHSLALRSDGSMVAWGDGRNGQTIPPAGLPGIMAIAAGVTHNLALQNDGWTVAPSIAVQPTSQTVIWGTNVNLSVAAGGTSPCSYQWRKNGVNLSDDGRVAGAGTAALTLSNAQFADAGNYDVVVTSGSTSLHSWVAVLTVVPALITSQPQSLTVDRGQNATFSVTASTALPLSFQWYKDGALLTGRTAASLTLTNVQGTDAGAYSVVITNGVGSVTSALAVLTVNLVATADSFNPGADDSVQALAVQADGKVLVGGWFASLGGQTRNELGRLLPGGGLDTTFNPGAGPTYDSSVNSLALQEDGKILVGGSFTALGGQTRRGLGRLNADGTLEASFNPGAGEVYSLTVQADAKILVGGYFSTLGGQTRNFLGRLNADGNLDTGFNPGANERVYCLTVQPDGKILVGGVFTTLGGQPRDRIARLNADGTLDASFNPGADLYVYSLALQADGKVLVGGYFNTLGGQPRSRLARLNANGTIDTSFDPGANGEVYSLAIQADGKILVAGNFSTLGGQTRHGLGRLNTDGTVDARFHPGSGGIQSLALQADGKVLAGGWFTMLAGQTRYMIGRLDNIEEATQSLSASSTSVTWLRAGTTPELWRTSFDYSSNSIDWLSLGAGVRVSGGWQLTGLSLPAGAAVRARGYLTGGQYNGSTWFVQSIIAPPIIVAQPTNLAVRSGQSAVFSVRASGTEPLAYQWRLNGVDLAGATATNRSIPSVQATDAGDYSVVVTNAYGSVTSRVAVLSVDPVATLVLGGLSHTYDGSSKAATVTTTPAGLSATVTYNGSALAPVNAGSYAVVATVDDPVYTGTVSGTLVIAKASQNITFAPLPGKTYGDANFALTAAASSGLAISFASGNTAVATLSGNSVTITGAGSALITASQAGDGNYEAAAPIVQTLVVSPTAATLSLGGLSQTFDGTPKPVTVTTTPPGLAVAVTYDGSASAPVNAGSYAVTGIVTNPNYTGSAAGTLVIGKASQTIAFAELPAKVLGNPPFALSASASSGLPVSFTSSDPSVATVTGSTVTIVAVGSAVITASQAGNNNYLPAAVQRTLSVATSLELSAGSVGGRYGTQVVVPFTARRFNGISIFQFSLHWNAALAGFLGVEQCGLPGLVAGSFGTAQTNSGTLTVSWDDPDLSGKSLPDGATVFAVRFLLHGHPGTTNQITIDGRPTSMEAADPNLALVAIVTVPGEMGIDPTADLSGMVRYGSSAAAVPGVTMTLTGGTNDTRLTGTEGGYAWSKLPIGNPYTLIPAKNDDSPAANGVTTLDITLIRRHILNLATLDSPAKLLAADVDGSQSVSTVDIARIRRLILCQADSFPAGLWRFVPSDYVCPDPLNPWDAPTNRLWPNLQTYLTNQDFLAIKLGDVNNTWTAPAGLSTAGQPVARQTGEAAARPTEMPSAGNPFPPVQFLVGCTNGPQASEVILPVTAAGFQGITALQFSLHWAPTAADFVKVEQLGLPGLAAGNFGTALTNTGTLTVSWDDPDGIGKTVADGTVLFSLRFFLRADPGATSQVIINGVPTPLEAANSAFEVVSVETTAGQLRVDSVPNHAPSFAKGSDLMSLQSSGPQVCSPWATAISRGPAYESSQTLNFIVSSDKTYLFSVPPALNATNGTLTYTPALNLRGTATVTVSLHDNGGIANGGVDTSAPQTFQITIGDSTDANHNGLPDDWEAAYGWSVGGPANPNQDSDGDGVTNGDEYLAGTDPANAADSLTITAVEAVSDGERISIRTVPGKIYRVERNDDYPTGPWNQVGTDVSGTGVIWQIVDSDAAPLRKAVYRVRLVQ